MAGGRSRAGCGGRTTTTITLSDRRPRQLQHSRPAQTALRTSLARVYSIPGRHSRPYGRPSRECTVYSVVIFCQNTARSAPSSILGFWIHPIDSIRGSRMLFSYIGPETMMPVASIIAAVAGVFMMFGRNVMGFCRHILRSIMPGSQRKPTPRVSPKVAPGVLGDIHSTPAGNRREFGGQHVRRIGPGVRAVRVPGCHGTPACGTPAPEIIGTSRPNAVFTLGSRAENGDRHPAHLRLARDVQDRPQAP